MKILSSVFLVVMLLISHSLFAHIGGHDSVHITEPTAQAIALQVADSLSAKDAGLGFGKLPETWASLTAESTAIFEKGTGYYVVSVNNEKEEKTLYVLMTDTGDVYDVSFTGEFEGVE